MSLRKVNLWVSLLPSPKPPRAAAPRHTPFSPAERASDPEFPAHPEMKSEIRPRTCPFHSKTSIGACRDFWDLAMVLFAPVCRNTGREIKAFKVGFQVDGVALPSSWPTGKSGCLGSLRNGRAPAHCAALANVHCSSALSPLRCRRSFHCCGRTFLASRLSTGACQLTASYHESPRSSSHGFQSHGSAARIPLYSELPSL